MEARNRSAHNEIDYSASLMLELAESSKPLCALLLLNANQRACQKPCSKYPKSWGLLKKNTYTAFTSHQTLFFPTQYKEEKLSGYHFKRKKWPQVNIIFAGVIPID